MAYPRVKDLVKDPDKKDAQEEVQRLYEQALNLYEIIMIRRLEGASGHLGYNKAKEEKELGFFSRRIDLASKLLLAFADSGYIKPFHLSSHEWQIYEQVKIAIEKGRYVRSTELGELGIILIMLEILIMWAGWQVMQLIEQNSWMLFILGVTTSWMLCEIWNTGRLSYKTLFAALQKIISTIKDCFGR
ncbi:MAG: hypothetical protein QXU11_06315 [Thermoproteota archaeon]